MASGASRTQLAAVKTWLVDTGPLVAYLDADDPAHGRTVERWDDFGGQFVTSGAVITEAMHFVGGHPDGPTQLVELVASSGMQVFDLCQPPELREAAVLMRKYGDTPMDFADATLVLVAEALNVADILTLDHRGFSTYRTRKGRALRIVNE